MSLRLAHPLIKRMDMTSKGINYNADLDFLLDASGTPLSMTSYAQFVDAQGGSADPIKDGKEEDNKEYEEEEETEEANTPFGKA